MLVGSVRHFIRGKGSTHRIPVTPPGVYVRRTPCSGTIRCPQRSTLTLPMPDNDVDFTSGISAFESREFAKALKFLSPFAEQGNPEAQYRMAIMYQNGLGIVRNDARALAMMRAAAEQGHALAQHGLGFMYLQGECTPKDEAQAAEWFRKAADQGMAGSQMTLGMMYEQGLGVEKDPQAAKHWYDQANRG